MFARFVKRITLLGAKCNCCGRFRGEFGESLEGTGRGDARSGGAWELGAGRAVVGCWTRGMRAVAERGAGRWPRSGGVLDAGMRGQKGNIFPFFAQAFF